MSHILQRMLSRGRSEASTDLKLRTIYKGAQVPLNYPILVISYHDESRAALQSSLNQQEIEAEPCATFVEAETKALNQIFNGILVDLPSIVKAKGEEKIVACSLAGFYPTLRVRTVGSMLVPMIMPGGARQEKSLKDFLEKACSTFFPRMLRAHRRHELCVPMVIGEGESEVRTFTLDVSWGGVFLVSMNPERFNRGDELTAYFPEFDLKVPVAVRWIQSWGGRKVPGVGCEFLEQREDLEAALGTLIKSPRDQDRDRLVA